MVRAAPLAPALVLDDLDQQDLAALDDVLDLVATHQAALQPLFVGQSRFGIDIVAGRSAVEIVLVLVVVRLGHDGFAVGDGDLVVVGVDFVEGEEAVAIAAVFNKGGLQAGLYAGDLGEVDVAAKLALRTGSEIEFLNLAPVHDGDPGLLGMRRIDQHCL